MKIFIGLLLACQLTWARDFSPVEKTYLGQGDLVTVRMVIGEGKARIFLVGKEAARVDLKNPAQLLSLTAFTDDGKKQELRFSRDGEFYVTMLPKKNPVVSMSVSTKVGDVQENVRLKVQDKP